MGANRGVDLLALVRLSCEVVDHLGLVNKGYLRDVKSGGLSAVVRVFGVPVNHHEVETAQGVQALLVSALPGGLRVQGQTQDPFAKHQVLVRYQNLLLRDEVLAHEEKGVNSFSHLIKLIDCGLVPIQVWCSGYHARFTRERPRVRPPFPVILFINEAKLKNTVETRGKSHLRRLHRTQRQLVAHCKLPLLMVQKTQ